MKSLQVVAYEASRAEEWDAFVTRSNNGTLFNRRDFLAYHPAERFRDASLMFYREGRLIAVLPAAFSPAPNDRLLRSHPGASYGGVILPDATSLRDTERIVRIFVDYARENAFDGIDLTLAPVVYQRRPSQQLDFLLMHHGFQYRKRELTSVVELFPDQKRMQQQMTSEARRAVRRAQKLGVEVKASRDFEQYYEMLGENLQLRHDAKPTHSLDELIWLADNFPNQIELLAAFADGRMCAGIVLFAANAKTALAFYISHDHSLQQYRGLNLLFWQAYARLAERGFRFLDFGTCSINMQPSWGMVRFKESMGGRAVFRDSLQLNFV